MKIGFSFGRCVRDIVKGDVAMEDVLVIIARTLMENEEHIVRVVSHYMGDSLWGLEEQKCLDVALELYRAGKIHQPRLIGSSRFSVHDSYVWMDVAPTAQNDNPMVKEAWEHYRTTLKLISEDVPNGDYTPKE